MRIAHRLYLTAVPSIIAVLLMAGLMYWGQYAHTAPAIVIVVGAIAVVASLIVTWSNARYVAQRIERLVGGVPRVGSTKPSLRGMASAVAPGAAAGPPDEIDEIERVVNRLSSAAESAEENRADRERSFERRAHDYALLLASIADASARRLEEVRLPLHILLDNHFGDLNENQEEMLGAARAAAEAADADMLSLRQIASLDLGDRSLRQDRIKPSELIEALRPMLIAAAEPTSSTVEFDVGPLLPTVLGDRVLLQEALVTLLRGAVESAPEHSSMRVGADRATDVVRFTVHGGGVAPVTVRWAAGVRAIQAHGGTVEKDATGLQIELPVQRAPR